MTTFPFTCREGHIEIGFNILAPDDDERCPLCLMRDLLLSNEPLELERVVHEYPYREEVGQ